MTKELYKQTGSVYYTLEFKPEQELIAAAWYGEHLSADEIKKACMLSLDLIRSQQISLFINDNRKLEGTWDNAEEWITTYWIPEAQKAGLKRFAHVIAQEFYAKLTAELIDDDNPSFSQDYQFRIFEDYEKALSWLERYHEEKLTE